MVRILVFEVLEYIVSGESGHEFIKDLSMLVTGGQVHLMSL